MPRKASTLRQCNVFLTTASLSLWAVLVCKFLESFAYMLSALTLRSYLEDNWGFGDMQAGVLYGIWGVMTSIFGILLSPLVDSVGVRYSLLTGTVLLSVARFWMAFTLSQHMMIFNLCVLLPAGGALGIPVVMISMRRYSIAAVGSIAYGLLFMAQCLGFFVSGMVVDIFRVTFPHKIHGSNSTSNSTLPTQNTSVWLQMSAYRYIQLVSAITTCTVFFIALLFVYDEEVVWVKRKKKKDKHEKVEKKKDGQARRDPDSVIRGCNIQTGDDLATLVGENNADGDYGGARWEMQSYNEKPQGTIMETLSSLNVRSFWIFMLLIFATLGVRMLGRHLDVTFPVYAERELGTGVQYGTMIATNQIATLFFTFMSIVLCSTLDIIPGILLGMTVTAIAAVWLCIYPSLWTGYMFAITMALGESIWTPRFFELSVSKAAPEGQEALFCALVYAPTFLVKLFTGLISGKLLETYVPEKGARESRMMWLIIALIAITSPLLVGAMHWSCNMFDVLLKKIPSANEKRDLLIRSDEKDAKEFGARKEEQESLIKES